MDEGDNLNSKIPNLDQMLANQEFLEKVIRLEMCMKESASLDSSLLPTLPERGSHPAIPEEELLMLAEDFVEKGYLTLGEKKEQWEKIISDSNTFAYFQDLIQYISQQSFDNSDKFYKTPNYLRKIVKKRLDNVASGRIKQQDIVIKIKDTLSLISGNLEKIFRLPVMHETVSTRSLGIATPENNLLQFLSIEPSDDSNVLFQVTKDASNSIMISIKLLNHSGELLRATIKQDNRILQTSSFRGDEYAYFTRIHPGIYRILVENKANGFRRSTDIHIIDDET